MELNSVSINLVTTKSVNFIPHRTSADGNCLFNSASLVVTGDESLSATLRILVCIELFLNAKFYAYHPYQEDAEERSLFDYDNTPFTYALSESSAPRFGDDDRQSCVRKEAIFMALIKEWASLICILALSTVIRRKICSYYPIIGLPAIEQLMNEGINPRLTCEYNDVFDVLWFRDSNFVNTDGKAYEPIHFVPLLAIRHVVAVQTKISDFTASVKPSQTKESSRDIQDDSKRDMNLNSEVNER